VRTRVSGCTPNAWPTVVKKAHHVTVHHAKAKKPKAPKHVKAVKATHAAHIKVPKVKHGTVVHAAHREKGKSI
jgi:hypothetical protein